MYKLLIEMDYAIRAIFLIFIVSCTTDVDFNVTSTIEPDNSSIVVEIVNETKEEILLDNSNSSAKNNFGLSVDLNSTNEIEKISMKLLEKNILCTRNENDEFPTKNDQFQCPSADAGSKFNVSCKFVSSAFVTSPGIIKCDVVYDGDLVKSTFPFTCDCVINASRPHEKINNRYSKIDRQHLKKIKCDCVDSDSDGQEPVCNCSSDSVPDWCNCTTPCVCHERQLYPNVVLRYNCTCNATNVVNTTIIVDPPFDNDRCELYDYGDGSVTIWVNCNFENFTTSTSTSTESYVSLNVSTNCPCEEIRLQEGKIIILHNCRCDSDQRSQTRISNLKSAINKCRCKELALLDGKVTLVHDCDCQRAKCQCEEARGILVCINCELNSTPSKTLSTYDYYRPNCPCEEVELFNGRVLVQLNCSCSPRTKVLRVRKSRQSTGVSAYYSCPCHKKDETLTVVKREAGSPAPLLVCSCVDDKTSTMAVETSATTDETSTTTDETSTTTVESPSTTLETSPTPTLTESTLQDVPKEKFWIRTVIRNSSILDAPQMAAKLAVAYHEAFHIQYKLRLGLSLRSKRQLRNNVTVQIIRVSTHPVEDNSKNTSLTEFIYVVKYEGDLVKPAVAVEDARLLQRDNRIEEILQHPVTLVAEEYVKPTTLPSAASLDNSPLVIVVGIALLFLLLLIIVIGYCLWKKKKRKREQGVSMETENRQPVFQELLIRNAIDENTKMADPLLAGLQSTRQLPIPKPRIPSKNLRNNEFSDDSTSQKRRRKKRKSGRPLPLDIHRQTESSPIKHGVFDHVPDSPILRQTSTSQIKPKTLLFPVNLEDPVASSMDLATISGSLEPFPTFHRPKRRAQSKLDEVDAMLKSKANRVCSSERLIEDIREELQKFNRSIDNTY